MSSSSDPTSKSWFVLELLLFLLSEGSVVSSKGLPEDLFLAFPLPDLPAIGKMGKIVKVFFGSDHHQSIK